MGSSAVRVALLGPLEVTVDGSTVDVEGVRPRQVLALLALAGGRALTVEQLIDDLWGEEPPATARKSVQVHVSVLRRAVGEAVVTDGAGYRLDAATDVTAAERALQSTSLGELAAALASWRGEPLAGLTSIPALDRAAVRLIELRRHLATRRVQRMLDLGQHHDVLGDLEQLTAQHPYDEELRAAQMTALYRSGRQVEALRAYQDLRRRLGEDIGVEPGEAIQDLEARVLAHDPSLVTHGGETTAPARAPSTLPARRSTILGREAALDAVLDLLDEHRLVTLTGTGGVGKTRLALEVAHHLAGRGEHAVFIDLTPASDDAEVLDTLVRTLTADDVTKATTTESLSALGERPLLVVADNCEHVIDGAADAIGTLLDRSGGARVLATSREALAIPGEAAWRVPPLGDETAALLFVERAQAAGGEVEASPEGLSAVAPIVARLEGLPLAIELAAARTGTLGLEGLRRRLDDLFGLPDAPRRGVPRRQETLRATVAWSHDLLDEDEKAFLRRLSVFQGGFELRDVSPVTAFEERVAIALADSLLRKSLVEPGESPTGRRYRLLETIREFGLDRLRSAGEEEATRDRHRDHFLGTVAGRPVYNAIYGDFDTMSRLIVDYANYRAAVDHALVTGDTLAALPVLATRPGEFLNPTADSNRRYIDAVLALDPGTRPERPRILIARAILAYFFHDLDLAHTTARHAVDALESGALDEDLFHAALCEFDVLGVASDALGRLDRLGTLAEALDDPREVHAALDERRSGLLLDGGDLDAATAAARRAFDVQITHGWPPFWSPHALVALLCMGGRHGEASEVIDRLEAAYHRRPRPAEAWVRHLIGIQRAQVHIGTGIPAEAAADLVGVFEETPEPTSFPGAAVATFAAFRAECGELDKAGSLLDAVTPINDPIMWWPVTHALGMGEADPGAQRRAYRGWYERPSEEPTATHAAGRRALLSELDHWRPPSGELSRGRC